MTNWVISLLNALVWFVAIIVAKLDLSKLTRQGWVRLRAKTSPHLIRWTYSYRG
jgi:hypothetical protein